MSLNKNLAEVFARHKIEIFNIIEDENHKRMTIELPQGSLNASLKRDLLYVAEPKWEVYFSDIPGNWTDVMRSGYPSSNESSPNPNVWKPAHYNMGGVEVVDAIDAWKLNFHRGNAIKYIARAGRKDASKEIEDLEKAAYYLNREIQRLYFIKGTNGSSSR